MGGYKKISKEDATNDFSKRKGDINRDGANRKTYADFNKRCAAKGMTLLGKTEYYEHVGYLFQCTRADFEEFEADAALPDSIRSLIEDFKDKAKRTKLYAEYRDWLFGKATQKMEHTGKDGEPIQVTTFLIPDNGRHGSTGD